MISMKQFYGIAGGLMVIVFIANCWNLIVSWSNMNLPGRIAFIFGSILFNILLSILFIGLYKITPSQIIDNSKLDDLLKQYEKK
jgi:TctA family transporter